MNPVISAKNLTKVYHIYNHKRDRVLEALSPIRKKYHQDFYALQNVCFDVKKGECIGFIGVNGAGKSTLLKILTGVLTPSGGEYSAHGKVSALLELGAGFNQDYTGIENIYLNGSIMGYSKEEMDQRIDRILEFAEIGEFVKQPVKTYSSGMFVRLAFAVAINVDPDILIVDEALSVGDAFFQLKCFQKFQEFKEKGKTIIFVSHDLNSIIKYCDCVYLLDKGRILSQGPPREIVDQYKKLLSGIPIGETGQGPEKGEAGQQAQPKPGNWKSALLTNPKCLDYGDGRASIIDYGVFNSRGLLTASLDKGSYCAFKMKVLFQEDIERPIFAFSIKDVKGTELTGTNTMLEGIDTGSKKAGELVEVEFAQKIDIQGGPYFLSLGCTRIGTNGNIEVMHRLYDVVELGMICEKYATGFYDMNSEITIQHLHNTNN